MPPKFMSLQQGIRAYKVTEDQLMKQDFQLMLWLNLLITKRNHLVLGSILTFMISLISNKNEIQKQHSIRCRKRSRSLDLFNRDLMVQKSKLAIIHST